MSSSPNTTLYGFGLSQPSRAVLWAAMMKQLPCHLKSVDPTLGETQTKTFLSKFPLGTIPSLEEQRLNESSVVCHDAEISAVATSADGSSTAEEVTASAASRTDADTQLPPFRVTEAGAILKYWCDANGWSDLYPSVSGGGLEALQQRARIDQWLHWKDANLRFATHDVFVPSVMARVKENLKNTALGKVVTKVAHAVLPETPVEKRQRELDEQREKEQQIRDKWDYALKIMTNGALKEHPFLAGDAVSIADLVCYCEIDQIHFSGLYDFKAWPAVWAWIQRMQQVPEHDSSHKNLFVLLEQVEMLANYPPCGNAGTPQPANASGNGNDKEQMKSPTEMREIGISSPSCDS